MNAHRTVFRWDLDKTYLRTEFDTIRDLVRTAFERATMKRTVPGAAALLRELRAVEPAAIFILSGSPEQMRRVLEEKLRLDGIRWDTFVLKPSLNQLLRGRFRFVRDQVGYKLGALLGSRAGLSVELDEVCFGDDAEADAFVYSLYADICAGRVGNDTLMAVLERARVHPDDAVRLARVAARVPQRDACRRIFIHLDRISPPEEFAELGSRVLPFYNYFQPALVLLDEGVIDAAAALRVGSELVIAHGFTPDALLASYLDLARRGQLGRTAATKILQTLEAGDPHRFATAAGVLADFGKELAGASRDLDDPVAVDLPAIDYVGLFSRDKLRARAARRRAQPRR